MDYRNSLRDCNMKAINAISPVRMNLIEELTVFKHKYLEIQMFRSHFPGSKFDGESLALFAFDLIDEWEKRLHIKRTAGLLRLDRYWKNRYQFNLSYISKSEGVIIKSSFRI